MIAGGAAIAVTALIMGPAPRAVSLPARTPSAVPASSAPSGNNTVIGTVSDAYPGQELDVASGGYAPLTDIDVTLDGLAWHETVRSDEFGRVIFTFLVPLIISIGRYILAISGCPRSTGAPSQSGSADSMLISVTVQKVTLFQFTVR
jgi:hypothetical protein